MKSISLLFLILAATSTSVALAQITTKAAELHSKTSFQKFADRLKIGYSGFLTTANVDDIERGVWKYAATSPETEDDTQKVDNRDALPTNIWNQISFNYNFGAKMNFVFNPRFTIPLASTGYMEGSDKGLITIEDFFVGFQGVVLSSEDKKFTLFFRPGIRLPTSQGIRNSGNAGLGSYTHQTELVFIPTYTFDKKWEISLFTQMRTWIIEDRYNFTRNRFSFIPSLQYTIDDVSRLQLAYENLIENSRRWESLNDKKPVYKDIWQNAYIGYSRDLTPKFTVNPMLSVFVNDTPITRESLWIAAFVTYSIK